MDMTSLEKRFRIIGSALGLDIPENISIEEFIKIKSDEIEILEKLLPSNSKDSIDIPLN